MVGQLLLRGMIAGLIAGVLAFGFARVYGEPYVDKAIAFEEQVAQAAGEPAEEELVSRDTQAGIGLATGVLVYGAALGGLFALAFAYANGRVGRISPRATAAVLGLLGFVVVVLVPAIKYPANPPAVGNPETIAYRTELYFFLLVVSVLAMILALQVGRRLWQSYGGWNASIVAGLVFVALIAVAKVALPDINEVPEQFSATVLWQFRTASLGIHAILWTVISLGFGALAERYLGNTSPRRTALA